MGEEERKRKRGVAVGEEILGEEWRSKKEEGGGKERGGRGEETAQSSVCVEWSESEIKISFIFGLFF